MLLSVSFVPLVDTVMPRGYHNAKPALLESLDEQGARYALHVLLISLPLKVEEESKRTALRDVASEKHLWAVKLLVSPAMQVLSIIREESPSAPPALWVDLRDPLESLAVLSALRAPTRTH